ncbi:MAG: hypothetical protein JNL83_36765 [Myxococcales bacterium]|nr:hypothetical protein [Myxococcales bacterium]
MQRFALVLALSALACAALPSPGLYLAIGLGIGAIGTGWIAYRRRGAPGLSRLAGAAAVTLGMVGLLLGTLRVVLALAAIRHLERILG